VTTDGRFEVTEVDGAAALRVTLPHGHQALTLAIGV
jgi:hypothetical protein